MNMKQRDAREAQDGLVEVVADAGGRARVPEAAEVGYCAGVGWEDCVEEGDAVPCGCGDGYLGCWG